LDSGRQADDLDLQGSPQINKQMEGSPSPRMSQSPIQQIEEEYYTTQKQESKQESSPE